MSAHGAAATAAATAAAAAAGGDVSEIVKAIQRVLAEHHVADARFVLELPSPTANGSAATTVVATTPATSPTKSAAQRESDGSAASQHAAPSSSAHNGTMLFTDLHANPAAAPPLPPAHQQPPPRARSSSPQSSMSPWQLSSVARQGSSVSPTSALATAPLLDATVVALDATSRPESERNVRGPEKRAAFQPAAPPRKLPVSEAPLISQAPTSSSQPAQVAAPPCRPSEKENELTDEAVAALAGDKLSEMRLLSETLARDLAVAQQKMERKKILQSFVGRSAILDDRRRREEQEQQQQPRHTLAAGPAGINGLSPATSTKLSTTTVEPTAYVQRSTPTDAAPTAVPRATTPVLHPTPPPQRRSVAQVAPVPSSSASEGNADRRVPSTQAGALPSLSQRKKPAVPGKTPVSGIADKETSQLGEQGCGSAHAGVVGTPTLPSTTAVYATAAAGTATEGKPYSNISAGESNGTVHPRHGQPVGASLLPGDRPRPSPVHEPLLGSAAEQEVQRQHSSFVQAQPPPTVAGQAPSLSGEVSAPIGTAGMLPKLWSEQSKENSQRASQLLAQSRLSQTTDSRPVPPSAATPPTTMRRGVDGATGPTPPHAAAAAVSVDEAPTAAAPPSLKALLQEQQRLQEESRNSMEEHQRLMQAARGVHPSASAPLSGSGVATKASGDTAAQRPAPATAAAPFRTARSLPSSAASSSLKTDVGGATPVGNSTSCASTPPPHTPPTTTTTTTGASAIHVVKFSLPEKQEARLEVVQQLSRSPAGTQHLDSKERYQALLASQKSQLREQKAKALDYKELVDRAILFNNMQAKK